MEYYQGDWRNRNSWNNRGYSECNNGQPVFEARYIDGMRYRNDLDWFSQTARTILEWFMTPTTAEGHQKLRKEILEGDDLQGYLDLANAQDYWKLNVMLAILAVLGFLAFLGGIGYNLYGKKQPKNTEKISTRVKMIPLFLVHIPLFVLVLVLLVLFSLNIWFMLPVTDRYADGTNDGLRMAREYCSEFGRKANCFYKTSIERGVASLKKQITDYSSNVTVDSEFSWFINNQLENIKSDKQTVSKLEMSASKLVDQISELKSMGSTESQSEFDQIINLIKTADKDLLTVLKSFDDGNVEKITEEVATLTKNLNKAALAASQPLLDKLDDLKNRLKPVILSVQSACEDTTKWIEVVGKRNMKTMEKIYQSGRSIDYFTYAQLVILVISVLALLGLTLGFFALAVRIVYPKAFGICATGTRKTRRFILFAFYAECLLVGVVAFSAGVGLYYAGHLNAACVPMYTRDSNENQIDKFYKFMGIGTTFMDYNGTTYLQSFVDVIYDYTLTKPNGRDLIPRRPEFDFDGWWENVNSRVNDQWNFDFKTPGLESIGKKMQQISSDVDKIAPTSLSDITKSHLASLVAEEINDFKIKLQNVQLRSLKQNVYRGFQQKMVPVYGLQQSLKNTFGSFYTDDFSNDFGNYGSRSLRNGYMLTGETMCVTLRTPAAGIWFAGTMLSMALLVSALVMFKTAKNLDFDFENKGVPITVSTIYSPLIDEEKNPNEQEI